MPHRSPRGRRRAPGSEAADRSGTRDRRSHCGDRRGCPRACRRRARRHSLARLDLRHLPVLPRRAREPVRPTAVHRLHPRRRLRHPCARRCALCFRAAAGGRRCRDCALVVRRPDRLAQLPDGRRSGETGDLWLRRCRASPRPGRGLARPQDLRIHPCGRRGGAAFRPKARRDLGRWLGRNAAGAARRGDHFRARGCARTRCAARGEKRRPGGVRRHSHVGHPAIPLPPPLGGASNRLGRQSDARGRARILGNRAAGGAQKRGHSLSAGESQRGAIRPARRPPRSRWRPRSATDARLRTPRAGRGRRGSRRRRPG